jgi:hypothetical protein
MKLCLNNIPFFVSRTTPPKNEGTRRSWKVVQDLALIAKPASEIRNVISAPKYENGQTNKGMSYYPPKGSVESLSPSLKDGEKIDGSFSVDSPGKTDLTLTSAEDENADNSSGLSVSTKNEPSTSASLHSSSLARCQCLNNFLTLTLRTNKLVLFL